ncbi:helix-turn-helix transcriptional regulator [Geobacillus subterraneus]|uniref:HTH cro/C1-type domain-containing protein n=1 Tax=Geobacillus subterraneus TaxID=129338 RepID=A0A679FZ00_9BACL|nr:helix-turn-helix transcriptional regulator [Geobacillus subterraneus]BBW98936.1 hypothetical protein GsuE55_37690 [Geobacillus subterraneus]
MYIREKTSISELRMQGYSIIEDDAIFVENCVGDVMKEKGWTVSDLAKKTGLSRQQVHAIVKGKIAPRIDFVLKISSVLETPVEKLFWLTEDAWVEYERKDHDVPLFLDMVHMEKVNAAEKKRFIRETGYVYYHVKTKQMFTEREIAREWRRFKELCLPKALKEVKNTHPSLSSLQQRSLAIRLLKEEFYGVHQKIFKRIVKRVQGR